MTKVVLALFEGTPEQRLFGENAVKLLEIIVNSSSFQEKVLSAKYSGCLFWDDNGREIVVENQFILNQILTGKERKTQPDNIISIQVRLDKLKRGVLGSVTLPKPLITTNISYFKDWHKNNQALSLAAHWMHEWLHVSSIRRRRRTSWPRPATRTAKASPRSKSGTARKAATTAPSSRPWRSTCRPSSRTSSA